MALFRFPFLPREVPSARDHDKHKYHFIHIPKNAGTSVRAALARRGDVSLGEPFHSRYIDVVGDLPESLSYFCVVRNPWSRTASRYVFSKQTARDWESHDPRKQYIENASFEDFVTDQRIFEIPEHPGKPWMGPMNSWFNQVEWITNENQLVCCDCLRMEQLEHDLQVYFHEPVKVVRENKTRNRYNYKDMYTNKLIEIVGETFQRDIEHFGFTFEGSATRGIVAETKVISES